MLHTTNPEILFLKQEDVVKAGLLDMKQIIEVTEKTYSMLGKGQIKNPPKTNTSIPDKENWQSFFNSMPCYIGGDVHIAGVKWAAESKKNATIPGIPYGIDISILSDPETVLPFCILDGTLITAMRTSAVGGVLAKYAAPSNATTATLVGAGVIGRTMVSAIHEALPQIKTMYLCDLDVAKAEEIAQEYSEKLGVEIIPDERLEGLGAEVPADRRGDDRAHPDHRQVLADAGLRPCDDALRRGLRGGVPERRRRGRRLLDAAEKARQPAGQADAGGQARRGEHHRPERAGARREEAAYL